VESKYYSIKAASRMTGLTPDALRAWERRYKAVVPEREAKGRRLYSHDDIVRLELLKKASDNGHPIRLLAPLSNEQLQELLDEGPKAGRPDRSTDQIIEDLLDAINRYDVTQFERTLGWIAATLPVKELITHVLHPLLVEVGERWHEGRLSVAQEHTISSTLRNFIGAIIRLYPHHSTKHAIVFTTVSGERHEFGILMLYLYTASEGIRGHYLGPDVPPKEIANAAKETSSSVVALSSIYFGDDPQHLDRYRDLHRELEGQAEIWIGGAGASNVIENLPDVPMTLVHDLNDFERRIKLLEAQ